MEWSAEGRGDIILKSYDVEWSKPLVCPPAMMPYKKLPLLSHTREGQFSCSRVFSLSPFSFVLKGLLSRNQIKIYYCRGLAFHMGPVVLEILNNFVAQNPELLLVSKKTGGFAS